MERRAEVAVVGAGIVGLAAADALARAGADVICFEAAEPGSGQSAGSMRVFRHVHDRADLVELASRARRAWDGWSERAGQRLIGDEGVLFASPDVEETAELLAGSGVQHRVVDEDEQRRLLPILTPPGGRALYDVRGGAIRAKETIAALASWLGDRLVREAVLGIDSDGNLETPSGTRRFERVLVCAGAETPKLAAPVGVELPLEIRDHTRVTFPVRDARDGLVCWLDRTNVYGASVYSGPLPALGGFAVGLATEDSDPAGSVARVRGYVERALPGLDPEPIDTVTRPLTILPWHPDAFAVWEAGAVLVFTGHNLFKFASVLGVLLADACRSGEIPPELRPPGRPSA
jgi:glycine/D-amino acid oxidase-like deaminating enzyme